MLHKLIIAHNNFVIVLCMLVSFSLQACNCPLKAFIVRYKLVNFSLQALLFATKGFLVGIVIVKVRENLVIIFLSLASFTPITMFKFTKSSDQHSLCLILSVFVSSLYTCSSSPLLYLHYLCLSSLSISSLYLFISLPYLVFFT